MTEPKFSRQAGFSLIELIIVMLIISILSVMAVLSFRAEKTYGADTQAYEIMDVLNEARQRSMTQHETMRVEFNQTKNLVRLISENDAATVDDDKELRKLDLPSANLVTVGQNPKNVSKTPAEMSPTPILNYKKSVYPLSSGDTVATLRYTKTGIVLDAGSNAIGDNSTTTGATIYVWMPDPNSVSQKNSNVLNGSANNSQTTSTGSIIRAITVQGTSGLAKFWKCPVINGVCDTWQQ